ncbi:hypothetical protein CspeluHIS016_0503180 [Cutaneotrichosporon spelunceum]|uniref:F-box domain-containing protein n=1 Tax=Cutaneotrichosporon spelunceum TaxID=1672016 RepID=A0AAD3TWR6_9TREE|nr:hypothetical protein CspeluHIS016_0503180 [Cutaneotrichosporon spelunceum]
MPAKTNLSLSKFFRKNPLKRLFIHRHHTVSDSLWGEYTIRTTSTNSDDVPFDCERYHSVWDKVLSYMDVPELLAVRGTCRTIHQSATHRLATHAVLRGDDANKGTDILWSAHANISLTQNPFLWHCMQILGIVGSCDCDAGWNPRMKCTCLEFLGTILDQIVPYKLKIDTIRIYMRSFRSGPPFKTDMVRAKHTIYVIDHFPTKPSMCVLPLAPVGKSKGVAINIRYSQYSPNVPFTVFKGENYNRHTAYSVQFLPRTRPNLPGWYGSKTNGSRVYVHRHGTNVDRLAQNLLGLFAELSVTQPGRATFTLGRVDKWPGCWFSSDPRIVSNLVEYVGIPWRDLVPTAARDSFRTKHMAAQEHHLDHATEEEVRSCAEYYAARRLLTEPSLTLEGACVCGCFFVE